MITAIEAADLAMEIHIKAQGARALIHVLHDMTESGLDPKDPNEPHSAMQRHCACLESLRMHIDEMERLVDAAAEQVDVVPQGAA